MDWLLALIAKLNGFTDDDLAQIGKALPHTRKALDILIQAEPLLKEIEPIYAGLLKEWEAVAPVIDRFLQVAGQRVGVGEDPMDTLVAIRNAIAKLEPKEGKLPRP